MDGAVAVLVQLRVGGQRARLVDETLPGRFGLLGQETAGPGGFAKALRTVPVVLGIADTVRKLAAPDAWVVDFTNPVGIVTWALLYAGHRAVGLCNSAIGFQRRLAGVLGVPPDRVRLDHAGLNHLTWIRGVSVDGVERLAELLDSPALAEIAADTGLPAELLRTLRAIPSYYLHYFYCIDEAVRDQASGQTRAEEVLEIERTLLAMYADPALDHKPALLERRGGLLQRGGRGAGDLAADRRRRAPLRGRPPRRHDRGLPDEAVVEVPATVDTAGPHPVPVAPLAPEMLGLVQAVTAYELLAIEAALTGSREVALRALLANPLVRQWQPRRAAAGPAAGGEPAVPAAVLRCPSRRSSGSPGGAGRGGVGGDDARPQRHAGRAARGRGPALGVAVVSGAGINATGVHPSGRTARFLALGDYTGDSGGGIGLGTAALGAAVRSRDGRGPGTVLARSVPAAFGLRRPAEVAVAVHSGAVPYEGLHVLAPVLFAPAAAGDAVAAWLVGGFADAVAVMATALIRRLRLARSGVEVVLGGGTLQTGDRVLRARRRGRQRRRARRPGPRPRRTPRLRRPRRSLDHDQRTPRRTPPPPPHPHP